MPLYTGAAEMAIRSKAELVPLAIERYGRNYIINIGQNILNSDMSLNYKRQLTEVLRDAIATLRWEIWESQRGTKRAEIPQTYRLSKLQELEEQMHGVYTIEDIEITRFHTNAEFTQKEVEGHLDRLRPCRENAFLFRK